MCAIAGVVGLSYNEEILQNMEKTMVRRGPDGRGVALLGPCALLHRRLAIVDLEMGSQPMQLERNGEKYTLIYNGELYNTSQVRRELQDLGHRFLGHSDTEVVLHAYAQWQEACLPKFNGIFAFGVWEQKKGRLFLARDPMGVKPLFYAKHQGGLLFASEIKTLLAYPTLDAKLDGEGCAQILLLGPGRIPGSGVFYGVEELEPGEYAFYQDAKLQKTRYWYLQDREHTDSFTETVRKVRYLVTDAIKGQMVSDVPIGTFLSGGLDSSLISAICAREKGPGELPTFSLDYADSQKYFTPGFFQPESDNSYIEIMQQAIASRHCWTVLTPEDLMGALESATYARDLPGMADVDFSLLAFCKDIAGCVKVALSGECADEIFGGYPWYRDKNVRQQAGFPWAQNTALRASFLNPDCCRGIDPEAFVMDQYEKTLRESDILPGTNPEEARMKQMVNLNYRWFMQTLLDRKDRMSMYNSLEVRVPFCDKRIASYLYAVPWEYKDYQGREKGLLRCAMEGVLPEKVLHRRKSPYPKTYDPRYTRLVQQGLAELLEDNQAPIHQLVNRKSLESLLQADYSWPWYGQLMKVPQTIAYMLQINYWLKAYRIQLI